MRTEVTDPARILHVNITSTSRLAVYHLHTGTWESLRKTLPVIVKRCLVHSMPVSLGILEIIISVIWHILLFI